MSCVLLTASIAALLAAQMRAEDWPTYRHDMARRGITSHRIELPLVESWVFNSAHRPQPAWRDPNPRAINGDGVAEGRRVHFDDVFQPVASGDSVFFGSSADNKVYCLGAETGHVRWTRITGGPIHFGGQRPGCWINAIPAAGLVLVPEASAGCVCTFPNVCTVVLQPTRPSKAWKRYLASGVPDGKGLVARQK